jgi:hypothetical protein
LFGIGFFGFCRCKRKIQRQISRPTAQINVGQSNFSGCENYALAGIDEAPKGWEQSGVTRRG